MLMGNLIALLKPIPLPTLRSVFMIAWISLLISGGKALSFFKLSLIYTLLFDDAVYLYPVSTYLGLNVTPFFPPQQRFYFIQPPRESTT